MLETIFCEIDDFCKQIEKELPKRLLMGNAKRARKSRLEVSEIMTLCVYYHVSGYKTFKAYYENHVLIHLQKEFHSLVSYSRFIELKGKVNLLLVLFAKLKSRGVCTGISIIDSTPLRVCHIRRASSHKTFRGLSKKGYSSTGWFYGLKLHLVINHLGEIVDFAITPGNVSDANKELIEKLSKLIQGLLIGDKGYIELFRTLYQKGIFLIHKVRKNMKNFPMLMLHKLLLSKRSLIETVNGILKESLSIEHTRHRSPWNFIGYVCSAIAAYALRPKKPTLCIENLILP